MHPIEQLRYVARASGADAGILVHEAASALGVFRNDPAAMITAARRLLTRQPAVGPLWWMCSRMTTCDDPWLEARAIVNELEADRTDRELAHNLPDGATVVIAGWPDVIVSALPRRGDVQVLVVDVEGQGPSVVRRLDRADVMAEYIDAAHLAGAVSEADLVLVEAAVAGDAAALVDVGSVALAATARALSTPTWLVAPLGRRLPELYWQAIIERTAERWEPAWTAPHEVLSIGLVDRVVTGDGVLLPAELGPCGVEVASELLRELT